MSNSRKDSVDQLVLDKTAADFSAAGSVAVAEGDATAQTVVVDCLGCEFVDVIVDLTNVGTTPATKAAIVGRASGKAAPDVAVASDWSTINTEAVDTATGIATIVPYIGEIATPSAGRYIVTFPVKARHFSALVWVDAAAATRGNVYFFRR